MEEGKREELRPLRPRNAGGAMARHVACGKGEILLLKSEVETGSVAF